MSVLNEMIQQLINNYHKVVNDEINKRLQQKFKKKVQDIDLSDFHIVHTYAGQQLMDLNKNVIIYWSYPSIEKVENKYVCKSQIDNQVREI
jgi:hypothetical protein